eukprot:10239155-Alexandrium_andersonii.AAC.1
MLASPAFPAWLLSARPLRLWLAGFLASPFSPPLAVAWRSPLLGLLVVGGASSLLLPVRLRP